ncbi:MAG: hypothetical protein RL885_24405 [Planctomycetota bacterium]
MPGQVYLGADAYDWLCKAENARGVATKEGYVAATAPASTSEAALIGEAHNPTGGAIQSGKSGQGDVALGAIVSTLEKFGVSLSDRMSWAVIKDGAHLRVEVLQTGATNFTLGALSGQSSTGKNYVEVHLAAAKKGSRQQ